MGRHSIDPAPAPLAVERAPQEHEVPVTDPVLLDVVQHELERFRATERRSGPRPLDQPAATKRVEIPFSGAVDMPDEDRAVSDRPRPGSGLLPEPRPVPARARLQPLPAPAVAPRPAPPKREPDLPAPPPVAAMPAAHRLPPATGPVIVPTHRPAPLPTEPDRRIEDDEARPPAPIGLSMRTLLLGTGVGVAAATALSLLAVLPR